MNIKIKDTQTTNTFASDLTLSQMALAHWCYALSATLFFVFHFLVVDMVVVMEVGKVVGMFSQFFAMLLLFFWFLLLHFASKSKT